MKSARPVSYTHLDVYKRQMFYRLSDDPVMLTLFSPFATGFVALFNSAWTALPVWVLPVLLLQAAVCGVLGFWAFCRRPSERAESGASKGFRWAVRFCASAAGAFVGSYGLLYFLDAYPAFLLDVYKRQGGRFAALRQRMRCEVPGVRRA